MSWLPNTCTVTSAMCLCFMPDRNHWNAIIMTLIRAELRGAPEDAATVSELWAVIEKYEHAEKK